MPRFIIDTSGPGTLNQWGVIGASGWEAVSRTSDDSTYIETNVAANVSDFFCGNGFSPSGGRIMAVTLHYRIRRTTASPATITFAITRSMASYSIGVVNITGSSWVDGQIRVREDWLSGTRFTGAEVQDLGVSVDATAVPVGGYLQVSKLWLEIEYIDTFRFYDPYDGVTPDAGVGQKAWIATGTEAYSINVAKYLEINDTSVGAFRAFIYQAYGPKLSSEYITEVEGRFRLSNAGAGNIPFGLLCAIFSDHHVVLVPVRFGGVNYLGLPYNAPDAGDMSKYLDIQPFNFLAEDFHVRLVVDRDSTPETYGKAQCFVNYDTVPFLQADYHAFFPIPAGINWLGFGTDSNFLNTTIKIETDYIAWKHYKKRGSTFKYFKDVEAGQNRIEASSSDMDIVKPILLNPPGVTAGQSNFACMLDVQEPAEYCEIYQLDVLPDPAPTTYKIDIDYKMDIVGCEGELILQRASDLWYWNEGTSSWQGTESTVTLPNSTVRTVMAAMTTISVTDVEDPIFVTIRRKTTTPPAYKILVYRVYLDRE